MEGLRAPLRRSGARRAVERAEMELAVIDRMGYNAYFLIVWDFVKWAKDNGIAVGPGRGSAAGSIVAYTLRITDVDPLRYDLLFERFLNPERVSMPDIDIDFSVRGRERVMQYVVAKYGRESVAQIITFGKMFPRAATRDAARVLGHDYGVGDRLAKLIPDPEQGRPPTFDRCLQPRRAAARRLRHRRHGQADRRRRARPGGDRAQRVDPRRRGRHRRDAAHRRRAAAARRLRRRQRERQRQRRARLPARHPVLDEAGRGARPAEDGLPGPAQPRRHRGRAGHHRALQRPAPGHDEPAARRRQDLRDDGPRRLGRRVPVRVRGHAERPAPGQADRVRRPRRARRAVPPGRDGPDPGLRARQAQPRRGHRARRAPGADHRLDLRRDPVPGAGHADLQDAGRLLGRQGRRPAQGDRQEEPRRRWPRSSPSSVEGCRANGVAQRRHRLAVDDEREAPPTTRSTSPTPPATR